MIRYNRYEIIGRDGRRRPVPPDATDLSNILQDGERLHVPFADSDEGQPLLHDGFGNPVGHRPGFIYSNDRAILAAQEEVAAAREEHKRWLSDAWRQPRATTITDNKTNTPSTFTPIADDTIEAARAAQLDYLANAWKHPK